MSVRSYDPKTYELAEHFMADQQTESEEVHKGLVHELALAIQEAVEDWFVDKGM